MVEQAPFKHLVAGSSPARPTFSFVKMKFAPSLMGLFLALSPSLLSAHDVPPGKYSLVVAEVYGSRASKPEYYFVFGGASDVRGGETICKTLESLKKLLAERPRGSMLDAWPVCTEPQRPSDAEVEDLEQSKYRAQRFLGKPEVCQPDSRWLSPAGTGRHHRTRKKKTDPGGIGASPARKPVLAISARSYHRLLRCHSAGMKDAFTVDTFRRRGPDPSHGQRHLKML